jgi:hypothetical protein
MLHRFTRRISVAITMSLATCSTLAFCQASPFEPVLNQPYSAKFVQTVQILNESRRITHETKLFKARDSRGRTRIEVYSSDRPGDCQNSSLPITINLYVPSRRQFIQLFPAQKMARVMTFPGTGPIPTHGPNPNAVKTTTERLGGQLIHGIYAVGTRTTRVIPADGSDLDVVEVEETWVSPDLEIVVFARNSSTDPRSDQTIMEVQGLERVEPDAALFEVPLNYKIVTATNGPKSVSLAGSPDTQQPARKP